MRRLTYNNRLLSIQNNKQNLKSVPFNYPESDDVYFAEDNGEEPIAESLAHQNGHCGHDHTISGAMKYSFEYAQEPISAHISYHEATRSDTARRLGLDNTPNQEQLANMKVLAERVFEPLRNHFNRPIPISSFFRTEAVNRAVKGSSTSDHMTGRSMDIDVDGLNGITNAQVFYYIKDNLEFDQLIWEKGDNANPSWVHVSYREGNNRNQVLRYDGNTYSAFTYMSKGYGDPSPIQNMNFSQRGLDFLIGEEGFRENVYRDAGGFLTIGYGHKLTDAEVRAYQNNTYQFQNGITRQQARNLLVDDVERIAVRPIKSFVKVGLTQNQFDAAVSYVFNSGRGNTLDRNFGRKLNNKDFNGAASEMDIVTSNGTYVERLDRRRQAERDMFLNGVYNHSDNYRPSRGQSVSSFGDPFPNIRSAKFKAFLPTILEHEGGFVNHPSDPGGATNKGITIGTFQQHAQSILGLEPTLENLKNITDEEAGLIYERIYWNRLHAEEINDVQVAYQYVDFFINAGGNAVRVMQNTLNQLGQSVEVDGGMGPKTLEAINSVEGQVLFDAFKQNRLQYYNDLVSRKPEMNVFLNTWTRRTNSFVYDQNNLSGGKSLEENHSTFTTQLSYSFTDKLFRTDFSGNYNSRVHNRWIKQGTLSPYATKFTQAFNDRFMQLFGPGPVYPTLEEVLNKISVGNLTNTNDQLITEYKKKLFSANIHAIIDTLNVESEDRYAPGDGKTYCNIYAYDVVAGLGGYLPRLWWYSDIESQIIDKTISPEDNHPTHNKKYKNIYGQGILQEQSANSLNAWFDRIGGPYFGWEKTTDMEVAQQAANDGHIVIISAKKPSGHGHINIIVPEIPGITPVKSGTLPLQSQAGASNFKYSRGSSWWNNSSHTNGAAWIYKGEIKSPIIDTPLRLGGAYA